MLLPMVKRHIHPVYPELAKHFLLTGDNPGLPVLKLFLPNDSNLRLKPQRYSRRIVPDAEQQVNS